jgi:hypothetical protein
MIQVLIGASSSSDGGMISFRALERVAMNGLVFPSKVRAGDERIRNVEGPA